ncbi:MAG: hypothetical protein HXY43_13580 [Fischerella sp.]|jgi:hypothetical protein|uniref:DUF6653 family protein n=1 Tax=Fischerella sp. TaxID=1191 RepID=UPI0018205495|nr:DUF6653 family protein [Fischerella sp.]NWF60256.1 hypothetical protein [Fischerella sp.]
MDIFKITERSFAMDDEVWAHHANPWSVWTRYTTLPLIIIAIIGMVFVIWGVAVLAIWPTLFGTALVYLGKLWFCDRMVWLYEDTKDADPQYQSWLY